MAATEREVGEISVVATVRYQTIPFPYRNGGRSSEGENYEEVFIRERDDVRVEMRLVQDVMSERAIFKEQQTNCNECARGGEDCENRSDADIYVASMGIFASEEKCSLYSEGKAERMAFGKAPASERADNFCSTDSRRLHNRGDVTRNLRSIAAFN